MAHSSPARAIIETVRHEIGQFWLLDGLVTAGYSLGREKLLVARFMNATVDHDDVEFVVVLLLVSRGSTLLDACLLEGF